MLKNHLLTAVRHIKGDKGYSVINIVGLSIGLACFIIFYFSWKYENSFEKFYSNSGNIFHVRETVNVAGKNMEWDRIHPGVAKAVKEEIPGIKAAACILIGNGEKTIIVGNRAYTEKMILADGSFFDIFSIPIVKAQKERCLDNPNAVMLSESKAVKYFGQEDPLGKTIKISTGWSNDIEEFTVMGIIKDIPSTSILKADIICSSAKIDHSVFGLFIITSGENSAVKIESGIMSIIKSRYVESDNKMSDPVELNLQPVSEMHFTDIRINKYLSILGAAASIVLLLSIINCVNLSIGLSVKRIKEVGIRKTLGSSRIDLIVQHLVKSALINLLALIVALCVVHLIITKLPYTNLLREFNYREILDINLIAGLAGIFLIVTLLSGIYPAFYISRLNSASLLSKTGTGLQKRGILKKGIIFIQFAVLTIFMILSLGISKQMSYIENADLGYGKENVFIIEITDVRFLMGSESDVLRNELVKNPHIKEISTQNGYPSEFGVHDDMELPGKNEPVSWLVSHAGPGFLKTFGIPLLEGRDFTPEDDKSRRPLPVMINETAAKMLGEGSAVGKYFTELALHRTVKLPMQVIGVFKDFKERTLHYNVEPMMISVTNRLSTNIAVKMDGKDLQATVGYIKSTWEKIFPLMPVNYSFFDERIQKLYESDYRLGALSKLFTLLSIIISVMGLFALTALNTEQRKKEIGIRKVLGATVSELTSTFIKDIRLTAIAANILALPIGIFLIGKWLESFAYRTTIPIVYYVLLIGISFTIAFATIGAQVYRAAKANPVESLRSE